MAEVMGIMLRRKPKQVFTVFVSWNLSALWRRIKKFQWPWAPFNDPLNQDLPRDTTTNIVKYTEENLRQTPDINPYDPEIVALAVKLGMKEKNKREYIEATYKWVKNNIIFSMETPPDGARAVLKKGYGLCLSKMSVLVALARVAGIPARFISYKQEMGGGFMQMIAREMIGEEEEELVKEIQDAKPTFTHGCVEFFLDNEWIPADLTWTDEEEVGMEMPISKFGESPFGKWYNIIPDTVTRHESLPFANVRFKIALSVLMLRGIYDRVNERFNQIRENGRKKLEKMGRDTYTARMKKFYVPPPPLISE